MEENKDILDVEAQDLETQDVDAQDAPKGCPACLFPQAYFEPMKDNY